MGDEANSWVRRGNFSHTVCYRLDSSKLASVNSFATGLERSSPLKSRPEKASLDNQNPAPRSQQNRAKPTQRSASPLPQANVAAIFREAQSERKRFSSPHPRRKELEQGIAAKLFDKSIIQRLNSHSMLSPLKQFFSVKGNDKANSLKDLSWVKCFDHSGGRVAAVEAVDECMADLSKLFIGLKFAHGAHSRLHHGVYGDQSVAVKIVRVPDDENGDLRVQLEKQFNREVTLLSRLSHQNIIRFIAACREPPVYCVITEFLSVGSLRAYLHKLEQKSLPLEKLTTMALDIARGMEYLHSQGVIHRDLKPENILISQEFDMKIIDFGIACEEACCDSLPDDLGTFRWMAPEMIKRKSYGRKVDVYSFGLIVWEMVAGSIPYEDMTPVQAAFAVVNQNLKLIVPATAPPAICGLIEQCWSSNPEKRPEFSQVVKVLEQFKSLLAYNGAQSLPSQEWSRKPDMQ